MATRRYSVKTQVILLLVVLVLPVCATAVGYIWIARQAYGQQIREGMRHAVEIYFNQTADRMGSADTYLASSKRENVYVAQLYQMETRGEDVRAENFLWQELNKRCQYNTDADAYFFVVADGEYANVAIKSMFAGERAALRDYFLENCAETMPGNWFLREIAGTKWMIHGISMKNFSFGALINVSQLERDVNAEFSEREAWIEVFPEGEAAVPDGRTDSEDVIRLGNTDICARISVDRSALLRELPAVHQIGLVLVVVCLAAIPFLMLGLNRWLIVPLNRLHAAMCRLGEGDPDYRIAETGENRETWELNRRFNEMADQLTDLKIETYEKELARMEIEAINLRLQVNPHFLMNSLNIIFSMSKSGKIKEIKSFTKYLADYLRFSLWHTDGMVSLKNELKGIENYLEIQMVRFPGKFTWMFDVEEGIEEIFLPSLLILNFVENAVKYALDMEREIEIIVIARKKEDMVSISVCDTGNGMEPEVLDCLNRAEILTDGRGKHIGIWNCRRRMELIYGKEAQIHITSSPGEGTQIYLLLPEKAREIPVRRGAECDEKGAVGARGGSR